VVTHFATTRKEVWLTIDDGPADDTLAVLDLLDRHDAKATFFVTGVLIEKHADVVRQLLARGHTVANHSHTHPSASFWCSLPGRMAAEIDACNRAIAAAAGTPPRWFRATISPRYVGWRASPTACSARSCAASSP
jgi:peptidoglycan/xylan/chitin deacetylase (PgdA/CDA1 family)